MSRFEGFPLDRLRKCCTVLIRITLVFISSDERMMKKTDALPTMWKEFPIEQVVVHMSGRREVYTILRRSINWTCDCHKQENPTIPDFKEKPPVDPKELYEYLSNMIFKLKIQSGNGLSCPLWKHEKEFYSYPAAKTNHHAFEAGLAYHTATMVRLADSIGDIYPQLNKSLLFAGIMLLPIWPKWSSWRNLKNTEYTVRGNLIGHIALIDEEITKVLQDLKNWWPKRRSDCPSPCDLESPLRITEYGSPVRPKIMEAEIIHKDR